MISFSRWKENLYESITGEKFLSRRSHYGRDIVQTLDHVFIDGEITSFRDLSEACEFLNQQKEQRYLQENLLREYYKNLSPDRWVQWAQKQNIEKVTDTLIENWIQKASTKEFTLDPVVLEMRALHLINENELDFRLEDGSTVVLREEILTQLHDKIGHDPSLLTYMKQSSQHFMEIYKGMIHHGR